jgi:hypothetical protein
VEDEVAEMSEVVIFEVPAYVDVNLFYSRIRPRWPGWTVRDDEVWLIAARVEQDDTDLAALLREVEDLVFNLDLQAIRYCLDSRFYIMEAPSYEVARHRRRLSVA